MLFRSTYTLVVWHDYTGVTELPLQIAAGATVPVNVTLRKQGAR